LSDAVGALEFRVDPRPPPAAFESLRRAAWGDTQALPPNWDISLVHLGVYDGERLIGYVNVATDGATHAFLLDPTVHPDYRGRGIGTRLVQRAADLSRERGARWLHVDYTPELAGFYAGCGFRPTEAGLMRLDG